MKLGELRGAIRNARGVNPFIRVALATDIPPINFVLQKGALYEALDTAFPDGKGQETGLTFDPDNGLLSVEGSDSRSVDVAFLDDDDDGLLV